MAMLPFIGYNVGDYLSHWLALGNRPNAEKLPKIFQVNWFRRDEDGAFLWPGFGENLRVIAWALGRVNHTAAARETPIGLVPTADALDLDGLTLSPVQVEGVLAVNTGDWQGEAAQIDDWFTTIGDQRPVQLDDQLASLHRMLAAG
jgi:phosphoenolpyruvate carboxykinase (GTP)